MTSIILIFCWLAIVVSHTINKMRMRELQDKYEILREDQRLLRDDLMKESNNAGRITHQLVMVEMRILQKDIQSAAYARSVTKIHKQLAIRGNVNPGVSSRRVSTGEAVRLERTEDSG